MSSKLASIVKTLGSIIALVVYICSKNLLVYL